ncbi:MAG: stage III sporulation protein AF [Clostridiales bacterium]|jgi:stage III sporulation protein AF|nr:stage III sporulation protein AF [Clostridiales bacterium]
MLSWIISIAGIMVLTVLLDIILPEGQTNKYIKGIFSVIVVIVVITPFADIFKNGIDINKLFDFSSNQYAVDNNYINSVYAGMEKREETRIKDDLKADGIMIERADIILDAADKKKIVRINIFFKQSVFDGIPAHINISDTIKTRLSERYRLKKEDIRILIW